MFNDCLVLQRTSVMNERTCATAYRLITVFSYSCIYIYIHICNGDACQRALFHCSTGWRAQRHIEFDYNWPQIHLILNGQNGGVLLLFACECCCHVDRVDRVELCRIVLNVCDASDVLQRKLGRLAKISRTKQTTLRTKALSVMRCIK